MALRKRSLKDDVLWLKVPLIAFALCIAASFGVYLFAAYYWDNIIREESVAYNDYNLISSQVFAIEEAEQIIVSNIDRFSEMVSNQVMSEEDRVGLLAEIGAIREKYKLFPVIISVSEQETRLLDFPENVESPEEQVSLKRSSLALQLPLLHEEDLTRFLFEFTSPDRLLVNNRCVVTDLPVPESDMLDIIPHQQAACDFYWYTLHSEPYSYDGLDYD